MPSRLVTKSEKNRHGRLFGTQHPDYASATINLALTYEGMGNFKNAISYLTKALDTRRITLGENHPKYLAILKILADVYEKSGDKNKADELRKGSQ